MLIRGSRFRDNIKNTLSLSPRHPTHPFYHAPIALRQRRLWRHRYQDLAAKDHHRNQSRLEGPRQRLRQLFERAGLEEWIDSQRAKNQNLVPAWPNAEEKRVTTITIIPVKMVLLLAIRLLRFRRLPTMSLRPQFELDLPVDGKELCYLCMTHHHMDDANLANLCALHSAYDSGLLG